MQLMYRTLAVQSLLISRPLSAPPHPQSPDTMQGTSTATNKRKQAGRRGDVYLGRLSA